MSDKTVTSSKPEKQANSIDDRPLSTRRTLLKSLAVGGGGVIAVKTLPREWMKPIVDSVIVPVHAQSSVTYGLSAQVVVTHSGDNPADDAVQNTYGPGTHELVGASDSMDFEISGTIDPGIAQSVEVIIDATGGDLDTGAEVPLSPVTSDPDGTFDFPTIGTDDMPDNTNETLVILVSTLGADDSVITINFSEGPE